VVELKPQEDAMLRSKPLLSPDHHYQSTSTVSFLIRLDFDHFLFLAAIAGLIALAPCVASAQTDNSSGSAVQANSKPQICDGLNHDDSHELSLGLRKARSSDEGADEAEQQAGSQVSPESKGGDVRLPELKNSSSAAPEQVLLCKKKKTSAEADTAHPVDPPSLDSSPLPKQGSDSRKVPTAPMVSYSDGELTVNAQNARLRDVIEAIRVRTGISVEFPSESMNDRVFDQVGPAPLRDALTSLLYGSGYNYVIQTSSQDPQTVTKLVLSSQPHVAASAPPRQAPQPLLEQADNPAPYGGVGANNEAPSLPVQPIQNPTTVGIPVGFNIQQAATVSGKTTGQILDELQKQQQQVLDAQAPPPQ
jgi:hypothetical protein